jgi:hypothetical protein
VSLAGYRNVRGTFAITADGTFKIPDLLPGIYTLTIHVTGYGNTAQAVTVGVESLELDLIARRASQ